MALVQPCTLIVVGQTTQVGTQYFTDGGDSSNRLRIELFSSGEGFAAGGSLVAGTVPVTGPSIIATVFNGASSAQYVNGSLTPSASGNGGASGIIGLTLGSGYTQGGQFLNGKIAEFMAFNGALSQATISTIFQYGGRRYSQQWT